MTAFEKNHELLRLAACRGILLSEAQARTLRRAAVTLRRWAEEECGTSNSMASYAIERDEATGRPFRTIYPHDAQRPTRYAIPDREKGALDRVQRVCKRLGLHYFHQTDPRGCALYIDSQPLPENNYTRGIACDI